MMLGSFMENKQILNIIFTGVCENPQLEELDKHLHGWAQCKLEIHGIDAG